MAAHLGSVAKALRRLLGDDVATPPGRAQLDYLITLSGVCTSGRATRGMSVRGVG